MPLTRHTTAIADDAPGRFTDLTVLRVGPPDATQKVYLQAALHADEQPGIMALHHLLPLLEAADQDGRLKARFSLVPMANPLGMGQMMFQSHSGRYDLRSGTNFNRRWPDLLAAIEQGLDAALGDDAQENTRLVRARVMDWIARQHPVSAMQHLRLAIMAEAHDADYVFDLHCDDEALPHIFVTPDSLERLGPLADWIGSAAQLVAADSGGGSFDEVWPSLWSRLRARFPDRPIAMAAVAATLEYRGRPDVYDTVGQGDARNLLDYFIAQGLIAGTPSRNADPAPAPSALAATEMLRVQTPGLVAYRVALGDTVAKGDVVADLIALDGEAAFTGRTHVRAGTDGRVISRNQKKYVTRGEAIAKIVGTTPIKGRGDYLLED